MQVRLYSGMPGVTGFSDASDNLALPDKLIFSDKNLGEMAVDTN
jgi:hypothetical protein